MSKTPEQMAEEWALGTFKEPYSELISEDQYAYSVAVDAFLAGYKAAQEHAHAALEEAEATIAGLSDDFEGMRSLWLDAQELAIELQAQLDEK
jgi:hypothetical protein